MCKQKDDMDSKDYPYTPLTRAKSPYEGRKVSDGIVWPYRKLRSRQRVTYLRYLLGLPHFLVFLSASLIFALKLFQLVIRQRCSPEGVFTDSGMICNPSQRPVVTAASTTEMSNAPPVATTSTYIASPSASALTTTTSIASNVSTTLPCYIGIAEVALSVKWNRQLLTVLENIVSEMDKNRWEEALQLAYGICCELTPIVGNFWNALI